MPTSVFMIGRKVRWHKIWLVQRRNSARYRHTIIGIGRACGTLAASPRAPSYEKQKYTSKHILIAHVPHSTNLNVLTAVTYPSKLQINTKKQVTLHSLRFYSWIPSSNLTYTSTSQTSPPIITSCGWPLSAPFLPTASQTRQVLHRSLLGNTTVHWSGHKRIWVSPSFGTRYECLTPLRRQSNVLREATLFTRLKIR